MTCRATDAFIRASQEDKEDEREHERAEVERHRQLFEEAERQRRSALAANL
jgi:hypothetical protein